MKTKDNKKSVSKIGGNVPRMATPGDKNSASRTPKMTSNTLARMKQLLKSKNKK